MVMVVVVGHVPVCNLVGRGKVGLRLEVGVGLKVGLRVVVTMVGGVASRMTGTRSVIGS